jgi:hypothetical protein
VEKQRVVGLGVLDEPVHGAQDVGLGRLAHGVLLVVGQDDHVLALVAKVRVQVAAHVLDVVDAAAQLALLAEVVDADQQGFPAAGAVGVLEGVISRRTMAEVLGMRRRWRRGGVVPLGVSIAVDGGKGCTM